jgi:hypothetical protein
MNKSLLLAWGRLFLRIPRPIWQQEIARSARAREKSLAFMTPNHHRIRDFVVRNVEEVTIRSAVSTWRWHKVSTLRQEHWEHFLVSCERNNFCSVSPNWQTASEY